MIISTDGGLQPGDAKWAPMAEWLTANRFDVKQVPNDARIEIRDGSGIGVELYTLDRNGKLFWPNRAKQPPRHIEWHPMVQAPPDVLLPKEAP